MKKAVITIGIFIVAGLAWYLGSPLFIDNVVEEELVESARMEEVATGQFSGTDSFHKGQGTAKVISLETGTVVRFEDFSVTNGPALSVYLVKDASGDPDSGFVSLGKLKGNMGSQNYEVPADVDISEYGSVIVHCVPFNVTFAIAPLQ